MTTTRTFTDDEQAVLTRSLVAVRSAVTDDERDVIDAILRDGWRPAEAPLDGPTVLTENQRLDLDPADSVLFRNSGWLTIEFANGASAWYPPHMIRKVVLP